jgi:predicted nucleotidyltransferase
MASQYTFGIDPPSEILRLRDELGEDWPSITKAHQAGIDEKERLRAELGTFVQRDTSLVVFGSLARNEFTAKSDVDWTLLLDGAADPQHLDAALEIERRLVELGAIQPGAQGTFGGFAVSHDLIHNIGGGDDTNRNTTQRILLLLESAALGDRRAYDRVIRNILRRYVVEDLGGAAENAFKVPRFLLNDIVRYWRIVAVDFAHKRRLRAGSGWALRTAKLRMSRKLTFVAGLLSCYSCETDFAGMEGGVGPTGILRVVDHLARLVGKSPLDIVAGVILREPVLHEAARRMFDAYDEFLSMLDDAEVRRHLKDLSAEDADTDETYARTRVLGKQFQEALTHVFLDADTPLARLTRHYGLF